MIKTKLCKGDKVVVFRGEAARSLLDEKGKPQVCTILKVDRETGRAWLEVPRPKTRLGERETPIRGVDVWKTVRYNPKSGEAGGLKVIKRPLALSNLKVVEKAPRREFGN